MTIGILYISTGSYSIFWKDFYLSANQYLFPGIDKKYFVFTDAPVLYGEESDKNIIKTKIEHREWPYNTLLRFHIFDANKHLFSECDYLFYCNANTVFTRTIQPIEILPAEKDNYLVALSDCDLAPELHPDHFTYDRNPLSKAYIPYGQGQKYYRGGFFGGRTPEFLKLTQTCKEQIDIDLKSSIIALWHDESHLNKYLLDKPVKILDSIYGKAEEWEKPVEAKIIFRNKNMIKGLNKFKGIKQKMSINRFLQKKYKTKEIIIFSGGLGNQLFQYAFYLAKKAASPDLRINSYSIQRERLHNGFELQKLFGLSIPEYRSGLIRLVRKLLIFKKKKLFKTISSALLGLIRFAGVQIVEETGCSIFNPDYLRPRKGYALYFGFWQSPLYFENIQNEIQKTFTFDLSVLSGKSKNLLAEVQVRESVAVHIRRGDFLDNTKNINSPCGKNYYDKAIALIQSKIQNPHFVFFSDDPEWVKTNIPLSGAVYVDWNKGADSWQDLCLMSQCKHNIIANSTFSWWGAWLNENAEKTVIAPAVFVKDQKTPDIYPGNWMVIESV